MSAWSVILLVLCMLVALFAFGGVLVGIIAGLAKFLFVVLCIIFVASLVIGRGKK